MMYKEKIVEVKVFGANREHYETILDKTLKNGELVHIRQEQLPLASRTKVLCQCDLCGKDFERVRKDVKEQTFCGLSCRNSFLKSVNPNPEKEKIKVECEVCTKTIEVNEAKFHSQEYFLCSRKCYNKHRSNKYHGDALYNYQDDYCKCANDNCSNKVKTIKSDEKFRKNRFCSPKCYWEHRKNHYTELYYQESFFTDRKETEPEKRVREFLESHSIDFKQEYRISKYHVDFYLPKYDIAIEVYGDYWHCNPDIFNNEVKKIHKNQLGVHEYDKKRNAFLETKIKKVYIIWENDINNRFEESTNNILTFIRNDYTPFSCLTG